MGGGYIKCGDFEGEDKSGSPVHAVLSVAFRRAFGCDPSGRIVFALRGLFGRKRSSFESEVESALLSVNYDEVGRIPPTVAAHFLPFLRDYEAEICGRLGITAGDDIDTFMKRSTSSKYGFMQDDGWHLYCLRDLIQACERSRDTCTVVEISW